MNENLSELVQTEEADPIVFSESDLDLPETPADETEAEAPTVDATPEVEAIPITILAPWFEENSANFDNVNQVKVSIRGVDPTSNLIMAIKDGSGEQDENQEDKRVLKVFDNADTQPILALKGIEMDIYNNGFRAICEYEDNIYIKCYGVRTGLIVVFCNNIDGIMIPYNVSKVTRTDEVVPVVRRTAAEVEVKLAEAANLEDLQLRYKQSSKAIDDITTNKDAVYWLLSRQTEIYDINHHLQIDNVIIETLE
jgi:hypothetical protein